MSENEISTRDLKNILGIKELYELNEKIMNVIFDDEEKEKFFDKIISSGINLQNDFLRDIFQEEAAARKSFKQDYTPTCVCRLFSELVDDCDCIYDECAGTGSLSISFINKGVNNINCIELSGNVIPILLLNLSLRNVSGYVIQGDVLENKIFKIYRLIQGNKYSHVLEVRKFDFDVKTIISNPPYSLQYNGASDYRTEEFGTPPKSKADYLFVLDMISKLNYGGQIFVLLPHGVLFRGGQEQHIRKSLINKGYLRAVIGLPDKLFLNTSIPTALIHFVKNEEQQKDGVFIMDASGLFEKQAKVNIITNEQIKEIVRLFKNRTTKEKICRVVSLDEIRDNDYNLNIPRYIDNFEEEQIPDLREIVNDILKINKEIEECEKDLSNMMKDLVGGNYQNEVSEVIRLWQN